MTELAKYNRASFHGAWLHVWNSNYKENSLMIYEGSVYSLAYDREEGIVEIITSTENLFIELNEHTEESMAAFMLRLNVPDEELKDIPKESEIAARPIENSSALH